MKIRRQPAEGIKIDMTPMIDVVFQLLAFFLMTFKIASPEGDFSVKMPAVAAGSATSDTNLNYKLVMKANQDGTLATMKLNEDDISGKNVFDILHAKVDKLVGPRSASAPAPADSGPEIELDCEESLQYENVIRAITAVSGKIEVNEATGKREVIPLIEKIKFKKPVPK